MNPEFAYPSEEEIVEMSALAEKLFGTDTDPTQAEPTLGNSLRLIEIDKNTCIYKKVDGKIAGWSVVLPTSLSDKEAFVKGDMTEKVLFEKSIATPSFESLYLMAVVVLPEFRNQGLATRLMCAQIEYFKDRYGIADYSALALSEGGSGVVAALEKELGISIAKPAYSK